MNLLNAACPSPLSSVHVCFPLCVCEQVSAVSTLRCRCKMLPPWRDPGCCAVFLSPAQAAFARDTRINSASGFPCLHCARSANTTSAVILQTAPCLCPSASVHFSALSAKVREMLLWCVHTHSWDEPLSRSYPLLPSPSSAQVKALAVWR